MTNVVSKLYQAIETWSFKYNCYEAVHPWTPHCSASALEIGAIVFGEALKLYTPLYLFSQVMQRRFDYDSFKNTSQSIVRSTTFISANAFFVLLFFCSSQYVTGKFYYYAVAYIPGFLASAMAVMIEKPNRRSSLAFYVANVASEALFRICVGRGYLRPVPHGQVYIFTLSIAVIMMLAKQYGFEDDPLSTSIKLIVGPEEAKKRRRRTQQLPIKKDNDNLDPSADIETLPALRSSNEGEILSEVNEHQTRRSFGSIYNWIRWLLTTRHTLCPHPNCSCLHYVTRSSIRALLIGYSAQLGLKLLTKAPQLIKQPKLALHLVADTSLLSLGLFLCTFSGLYKAANCTLRWTLNESTANNCFISGLVAGPALFIYPSPTVALYVMWKCLENLFHVAVDKQMIKNRDMFIVILYGLATSQLFYSALMNPQFMKKSYMAFLDRMSRHRLHMVNRSVLDVFGTQASAGYEDFFPDLHPKFMSRAFLSSIWIWMLEQKVAATKCQ